MEGCSSRRSSRKGWKVGSSGRSGRRREMGTREEEEEEGRVRVEVTKLELGEEEWMRRTRRIGTC